MHIAVTGGCGFIGSHVVDHLAERELAATVAGADAVFHLARAADVNVVAADPVAATRLNVEGTARVIEAARQASVGWLVLASTVWVYDAAVGHGELTEHAPVDLRSPGHVYVATKLSAELIVHSYREMYGQHFTILGYGIPYGPRMRDALVVARFVRAAMEVVAARQPRVRAFGFTDRIPHLMSAADLVITSSGDRCS